MSLTGCVTDGKQAESLGLVSQCLDTPDKMWACVLETADILASKPSLALAGTKRILLHSR